jgi:hypothetical protein
MSPLSAELRQYNDDLDSRLQSKYGMTLRLYKTLKLLVQLVGAAAGIYAMSLGAPPLATFMMVTLIVSGPEVMEYFINVETDG